MPHCGASASQDLCQVKDTFNTTSIASPSADGNAQQYVFTCSSYHIERISHCQTGIYKIYFLSRPDFIATRGQIFTFVNLPF